MKICPKTDECDVKGCKHKQLHEENNIKVSACLNLCPVCIEYDEFLERYGN